MRKPPFGGAEQALKYLARYTYRVALSNDRIESLVDGQITFRYKAYAHGHRWRRMTLPAQEFLRRFLQHVLPKGFVRIRSFGFLANCLRDNNWPCAGNCFKPRRRPRSRRHPPNHPPSPLRQTIRTAVRTAARVFWNWSRELCGRGCRNWWPARISRGCSTVRNGACTRIPHMFLVTRFAAAGHARRTPVSKDAPQQSARPTCSAASPSTSPASTPTAALSNPQRNDRNHTAAGQLPDASPIAAPAPRFSSTGFYLVCSRSPCCTNGALLAGADQIESFTSLHCTAETRLPSLARQRIESPAWKTGSLLSSAARAFSRCLVRRLQASVFG